MDRFEAAPRRGAERDLAILAIVSPIGALAMFILGTRTDAWFIVAGLTCAIVGTLATAPLAGILGRTIDSRWPWRLALALVAGAPWGALSGAIGVVLADVLVSPPGGVLMTAMWGFGVGAFAGAAQTASYWLVRVPLIRHHRRTWPALVVPLTAAPFLIHGFFIAVWPVMTMFR